ncbi:thiamine pyrophosphate-binding protein, partial [Streptomyces sp. NPDC003691]
MPQANRHIYAEAIGRRRFADRLVRLLAGHGTDTVFAMPAESLNAFVDAIRKDGRIRLIGVRHEGAGGIMAAAYAKLTGRLGVCAGTAGPGATHLPFGTYDALADRAPLLALAGQVPVGHVGTRSFQEIDPHSLFADSTLLNRTLTAPEQTGALVRTLARAVLSQGPVHLSVSSDVFAAPAPRPGPRRPAPTGGGADAKTVARAAELLGLPDTVVVVGRTSRPVTAEVTALAEHLGAPVLVLPEGHRHFAAPCDALRVTGDIHDEVRELVGRARRVLVAGARTASVGRLVGDRPVVQVAPRGEWADTPAPGAPGRARAPRTPWLRLPGDERDTLTRLRTGAARPAPGELLREAAGRIGARTDGTRTGTGLWRALDTALPADAVVAVEPGPLLDGAFLGLATRDRALTSSFGFGLPAYALPAAIGACLALPGRPVTAVTSATALLDFLPELLTIRRYGLSLDVVCVGTAPDADLAAAARAAGLAAEHLPHPAALAPALAARLDVIV